MRQHSGNVHIGMEQQSFATNFLQKGRQQSQENSFQSEFQSIPRNAVGQREDLNSFQSNVNSFKSLTKSISKLKQLNVGPNPA